MTNPLLGKRYRILRGAVERAVLRKWGTLPRSEVARRMGLSLPTLRGIIRGHGVYNEATIERLEATLATDRMLLATAVDTGGGEIMPSFTALADLRAALIQRLIRFGGHFLVAQGSLRRANGLVHWAFSVQDEQREYRQLFSANNVPPHGAYALVDIDVPASAELDLVVSVVLPAPRGFDLAIDYGRLLLRDGQWTSTDIIGRESFHKRAAVRLPFVTFAPAAPGLRFLARANAAFGLTPRSCLPVADAEQRLMDAADPLVGFRARGLFHLG